MTDDDIARDRAIIEAASAAPWIVRPGCGDEGPMVFAADGDSVLRRYDGTPYIPDDDANFIAAARTRWPAALDEIDRLRTELATEKRRVAAMLAAARKETSDVHQAMAAGAVRDAVERAAKETP